MADKKIRVLLVTGPISPDHDPEVIPMLRFMLEYTDRFEVVLTEELRGATSRTFENYDLLFFTYTGMDQEGIRSWGAETEKAILDFVANGGGAVVYHSVFSNKNRACSDEYDKFLGFEYSFDVGVRKQPKIDFTVKNCPDSHPIMEGAGPEWITVQDDLFIWGNQIDPDIKVLMEVWDGEEDYDLTKMLKHRVADYKDLDIKSLKGINSYAPVAWCHNYGKGRVLATIIGHGPDTIRRPNFVSMIVRGSEWCATGEVTLPWLDLTGERRRNAWPYYKDIQWRDFYKLKP